MSIIPIHFFPIKVIENIDIDEKSEWKPMDPLEETSLVIENREEHQLPYHDMYKNVNFSLVDKRFNDTRLTLRGDTINPKTLIEQGGFLTSYMKGNTSRGKKYYMDPDAHRVSSDGTNMISTTTSMKLIKGYNYGDLFTTKYAYMVVAEGGFPTKEGQALSGEKEITVAGPIDIKNVVAARKLKRGDKAFDPEDPILINLEFISEHKNLLKYIISRFLEPYETLDISDISDIMEMLHISNHVSNNGFSFKTRKSVRKTRKSSRRVKKLKSVRKSTYK